MADPFYHERDEVEDSSAEESGFLIIKLNKRTKTTPRGEKTNRQKTGGQSNMTHSIDNRTSTGLQTPGARFNKEVQPTRSLILNSELSYSEMGNSEFSVTEQLNCVSLLNSK